MGAAWYDNDSGQLGTFSCYVAHMGYGLGICLGYAKGSIVNHLRGHGAISANEYFLAKWTEDFFIISPGGPNIFFFRFAPCRPWMINGQPLTRE